MHYKTAIKPTTAIPTRIVSCYFSPILVGTANNPIYFYPKFKFMHLSPSLSVTVTLIKHHKK